MKLIFLNRYYGPDISATSQIATDLARHLARAGREVHIVTSRQRYDDATANLPPAERIDGVHVHRVWTSRFGRGTLAGRAFDYLTFYLASAWALARLSGPGDIVVAMTDPPLVSLPAALVARARGARLVNWLQDVFPEIAARLGLRFARGPGGALARAARSYTLRRAALNVVLGERMRAALAQIEPRCAARLTVIPNWADGDTIRPQAASTSALRQALGWAGRFVVGYSGNFGRAHDFDTVRDAARALQRHADVVFSFTGGGHYMARLAAERLENVRLTGYVEQDALAESLGTCDVHLVTLRPELEGLLVPSKFYGVVAAGRPVIFVGDTDGEIARAVREADCGIVISAGDAPGLAAAILALRDDPARGVAMGRRARAAFEQHYDRHQAMRRWEDALAAVEAT